MLYFIINPNSRSGRGMEIWKDTERIVDASETPHKVFYTKYPGHAIRLAAEIPPGTEPEPNTIAVLGGDGSLNEVLNGIKLSPYNIMGYLPTGSGNDFARGMHLPVDAEKAVSHIINPSGYQTLDFGCVTYGEQKIKRRFLVSSGVGYDAAVCHRINNSRLKKFFNRIRLGKLAYIVLGIEQVLKCKMASGMLTIDGGTPMELKNIAFVSCHNLPYEGGGWPFAPGAEPDDGELDLCVVTAKTRLQLVWNLLGSLLGGRHIHHKGVSLIRCKQAALHLDCALPVHTDGEVVGFFRDLEFNCHHKALKAMW